MTRKDQHELTIAKLALRDAELAKVQYTIGQHTNRWLSRQDRLERRLRLAHDRWRRWNNRFAR